MKMTIITAIFFTLSIMLSAQSDDFGYIAENSVRDAESSLRMFEATGEREYAEKASAVINSIMKERDDRRGVESIVDSSENALILPLWSGVKFTFFRFDLRKLFPYFNENGRSNGEDMLCRFSQGRYLAVTRVDKGAGEVQDSFIINIDSTAERRVLRLFNNKKWDYFAPDTEDTLGVLSVDSEGILPERKNFAMPALMTTALVSSSVLYYVGMMDKYSMWGDSVSKRGAMLEDVRSAVEFHIEEYNEKEGLFEIRKDISKNLIPRIGYRTRDADFSFLPWNMQFCMGTVFARAEMYGLLKDLGWEGREAISYRMADVFMHNAKRSGLKKRNGYWVWKYNAEYGYDELYEDVLHGFYDVFFLNTVYKNQKNSKKNILSNKDMLLFAGSLTEGFFPEEIRYRTDVQGAEKGYYSMYTYLNRMDDRINAYRHWAAFWAPLCEYDPRVYEIGFNTCKPGFKRGESFLTLCENLWKPWNMSYSFKKSKNTIKSVEIKLDRISVIGDIEIALFSEDGKESYRKTLKSKGKKWRRTELTVMSKDAPFIEEGRFNLAISLTDPKVVSGGGRRRPLKKYSIVI